VAAATARNTKAGRRRQRPPIDVDALAAVLGGFRPGNLRYEDRDLRVTPGTPWRGKASPSCRSCWPSPWCPRTGRWNTPPGTASRTKRYPAVRSAGAGPRAGRTARRWCPGPARVRQQERHPLSVVLYPAPERADPAVRPFPADPRPRRIRRWARSPVFDAERAIGVHLLSPSPWADHTSPFGIASIKWHKSWSGTGGYLGWNDDLAPTLPG